MTGGSLRVKKLINFNDDFLQVSTDKWKHEYLHGYNSTIFVKKNVFIGRLRNF